MRRDDPQESFDLERRSNGIRASAIVRRRVREWWLTFVRALFLQAIRRATRTDEAPVRTEGPVAYDLWPCPQCYGHALQGWSDRVHCLECGLFVGTQSEDRLAACAAWNSVAQLRREQVVLASSIRSCSLLFREVNQP